ncbi:MAG: chemotaxis protein CheB [Nitrospiraceae bacterium]
MSGNGPSKINGERIARDVIVIGASLGGVSALKWLCSELPADFPGVIGVVLHRSPMYETDTQGIYERAGKIRVCEPSHEEPLQRGTVYFAPRDRHMLFHRNLIELSHGPKEHFTRPAIDPLFVSAASAFGTRVIGLLLTGGGSDGVRGLVCVKFHRGLSVIQDPTEAINPSMPVRALRDDHVDLVTSLKDIPSLLYDLASGSSILNKPS